jgi:hypothetical protein
VHQAVAAGFAPRRRKRGPGIWRIGHDHADADFSNRRFGERLPEGAEFQLAFEYLTISLKYAWAVRVKDPLAAAGAIGNAAQRAA